MKPLLSCLGVFLAVAPLHAAPITKTNAVDDAAIAQAMAGVAKARPRAEADPTRPIFHITAPANWINDPNGPIFHGGYYHLFYQHNPYGDQWGHMHWGHVRSRDLVQWEHLPIALWPSLETGEEHVFSGCATTNARGQPLIFYTSIKKGKSATDFAEQWAALGRQDLVKWQKDFANPVLTEALHGETKIYDWRDPFLFHHQGRTFLVLGGNLNRGKGGQAIVALYEATDKELTAWKYRGILFTHPDEKVPNIECPNFFPLDGKFVLVVSPHGKVQYFVGDFDLTTYSFKAQKRGLMDASSTCYAPNCMLDPQGRRIMWGWLRGFKEGLGWNGCLTLPRILKLDNNGDLAQSPAPELEKLRTNEMKLGHIPFEPGTNSMAGDMPSTIELAAELHCDKAAGLTLRVIRHASPKDVVNFSAQELGLIDGKNTVRLFVDRSVVEVYANETKCASRLLSGTGDIEPQIVLDSGAVEARSVTFWHISSIW
jgi:beta-fructofuranosidase